MARYRRKRRTEETAVDYWQSIADVLTALLLAALLLVSVLILVIASNSGWLEGSYYNQGAGNVNVEDVDGGHEDRWDDGSAYHGGGDWDGDGDWDSDNAYGAGGGAGDWDDPDPGAGEYDDFIRAAVRVTVVDAESGQPIQLEGIMFQLLKGGSTQTLSTYYPERQDYAQFQTNERGVFYLPEKIRSGDYVLSQLTAPSGYDKSEPVEFSIRENYDWPKPYELVVELWPCKNAVRIQQVDSISNRPVEGGSWDVIASSDIMTADGSVRLKKGEVADTISVGADGYGQSEDLFLGSYKLEQVEAPEGYAVYQESAGKLDIVVEEKLEGKDAAPLHTFALSKTRYTLRLIDQENKQSLQGASFRLNPEGVTLQSGKDGVVSFENLAKSTSYTIHQELGLDGYRLADDIAFYVDEKGLIDGSPSVDITVSNYVVRVSVDACGAVLRKPMAGVNLSLYSSDGSLVRQWTSRNTAEWFEGIQPGSYKLVGPEGTQEVAIADKAGTQEIKYSFMTVYDIVALAGAALLVVAIAGFAAYRVLRRRKGGE